MVQKPMIPPRLPGHPCTGPCLCQTEEDGREQLPRPCGSLLHGTQEGLGIRAALLAVGMEGFSRKSEKPPAQCSFLFPIP